MMEHDFYQPEESFHFSSDALLLRDFSLEHLRQKKLCKLIKNNMIEHNHNEKVIVMDLGCGCGVVGLSLLMAWYSIEKTMGDTNSHAVSSDHHSIKQKEINTTSLPDMHIIAVEREPILVQAALQNAKEFNFSEKYTVIQGDICHQSTAELVKKEIKKLGLQGSHIFNAIMCNPPWRQEKDGNPSPSDLRQRALFGDKQTLSAFFSFSRLFLKKHGSLFCVGAASYLLDYTNALEKDLNPIIIEHVHYGEKKATFFLLEACYQSRAKLCISYPKLER